jgi:hypothetical protein
VANTISVLNARDFIRRGGKFGNYTASSYELNGDRVVLIAECSACGAKNRIQWSHVASEQRSPGTLLCINRERHKAAPKAATPNWQSMSDAQFKAYVDSLPSDQYLAMTKKDPAFAARDAAHPNNYIDTKEALARKESADREAKLAPHRAMFKNAYYAYDTHNLRAPFHRLEGWLALPEAERQAIIKRFDLTNVDYTPSLEKLFGKSK